MIAFLFFLDLNQDMGHFLLLIVFGFFLVGFLWVGLVENPKEERRKSKWIKENKELLEMQDHLFLLLNGIGNQLPPCDKCESIEFQLWEVIKNEVTIRCTTCKKKYKHKIDASVKRGEGYKFDFHTILTSYINLVQFAFSVQQTKLGEYLRSYFIWSFFGLRKGPILYRAITFDSNPHVTPVGRSYDDIKNDEPSRRISQRVMDRVWNRDGGKCVECGSNEKLEFDHIIPFSKGGSNTYRNIQLLCESCNRSKSNKIG